MIHDRIAKIEATLAQAADLPSPIREELLVLLSDLKSEVGALAPVHGEQAQSITLSADAAISLATKAEKEAAPAVIQDFRASVAGFEASHPRLVQIVDQIALTLSNMGI